MGCIKGSGKVRICKAPTYGGGFRYTVNTWENGKCKKYYFKYTPEGLKAAEERLDMYRKKSLRKDESSNSEIKWKFKEGFSVNRETILNNFDIFYAKPMKKCFIRVYKIDAEKYNKYLHNKKTRSFTIRNGNFEKAFSDAVIEHSNLYSTDINDHNVIEKISNTKTFLWKIYEVFIKKYGIINDLNVLFPGAVIKETSSPAVLIEKLNESWVTEEQNVLQCSFKKMLEPTDNFKPKEIDSSLSFYDLIKENLIIMSAGVDRKIFHKKIENFFDNLLKLDKVFSKQPDLIFTRNYPGWKITKERKCTLLIDGNGKLFINDISVGKVNFNEKQFNNYNIVSYGTEIIEKVLEKDISDTINKITEQFEEIFIREPFSVDIGMLEFMKENKSKFYNGNAVDCIIDIKTVRSTSTELNVNYTKVHLCLKTTFGNIIIT
jgi:hypothetical protein